jgi:uncharacterized membrane protein YkvA (DUF1232 family)
MWLALKEWVQRLKRDTLALWFAGRDRRTPWGVRLLGILIVAYALSPIDLIPDFIPVIGYLDELILLPAGLWMLLKLIPEQVLSDSRDKANEWLASGHAKPRSALGAVIVIVIWVVIAWWLVLLFATSLGG